MVSVVHLLVGVTGLGVVQVGILGMITIGVKSKYELIVQVGI